MTISLIERQILLWIQTCLNSFHCWLWDKGNIWKYLYFWAITCITRSSVFDGIMVPKNLFVKVVGSNQTMCAIGDSSFNSFNYLQMDYVCQTRLLLKLLLLRAKCIADLYMKIAISWTSSHVCPKFQSEDLCALSSVCNRFLRWPAL